MNNAGFERLLSLVEQAGNPSDAEALADLRMHIATLERARMAAESANEAKTRFLASVSHEVRSPLNSIFGYAQLLERDQGTDPVKAAAVIRRSCEHLTNLVEGLLDISQVESGSLRLNRDIVRFPAFLEQLVEMFQPQARTKGIALSLERSPTLPEFVRTDEKRLRQVLINLLSNAIKFTDAGHVALKVHYRNEVATLEIEDSGIGISAQDLDRIFVPFERGSAAQVEGRSGVGLGLAITQALVHIMGGEISVTSTPGTGSRFAIRMMLSQPLVPPDEPLEPGQSNRLEYTGPQRTILIIDDDPAQRDMVRSLLVPMGFTILTAGDGDEGLRVALEERPDLILCDVSMPGKLSGWDVAAQLRDHLGPAVRIVMVSGETEAIASGRDGPANDLFITKPFHFDVLIDAIADQLQLRWTKPGVDILPEASSPDGEAPPARLPPPAEPLLAEIERLARQGHVRGIEARIDDLVACAPEASTLAGEMRTCLDCFNLKALARIAREAQHHGQ